jgi:hypothetical protein
MNLNQNQVTIRLGNYIVNEQINFNWADLPQNCTFEPGKPLNEQIQALLTQAQNQNTQNRQGQGQQQQTQNRAGDHAGQKL